MSMHFFPRALCALAASLVLAGCSLAPVHQRPQAPIPTQWPQQDAAPVLSSSAATLDWNSFIADRQLRQLVDLAQAHNRDLRQTLLNVEAARALYQVQRADRLPGVGLQGGGTRQRLPGDMNATGQPQVQGSWQAGLGLAAFELDLFGRVRNLSEAALGEYLATEEAARAARISLGAEVVQAYLSRDGALRRLQLAQRTLQSRESSLRLTAQRRQAGTATALDHQDALGLAAQARADVERSERELRQAGNALLLLTGVEDLGPYLSARSAGSAQSAKSSDLPMLLQDLSAGTPSELLIHRPDIQAAEHRLRARSADIGAARAAFFPRISLTGFLGSSSADLSDLFRSGQRAWSFTPQVTLPLFDGGRNRANLDLAVLRKDMAVAAYEQAIQTAFREVADALAATDTLRREEAARLALRDSSRESLRLAQARYQAGVDDHLRYLDAQRSAFANESAYIDTVTQRQLALAQLFRVLGGSWTAPPPPPPSQSQPVAAVQQP
ncbi:multidrug efflux system outer membrane protein [Delftia sp. 60]|uniref:efflux transporter outer membrane subunit n=1 Tax=Delftia sp. 60 TaxID=2035216 RepID=UPI000C1853FC|nr:efflux transporter outer membrane subunit [Delftia sp. 60]PIF35654.1 multidrug efflux system outer membrane protein [Burkholderiales bacterium 23]PIF69163.1 multidrug efflux system outer membrane protein [Delftia sp. 60]